MSPAASEKSFRYDAFSTTRTEVLKQELELFWQKSMSPFILGEASTAYLDRTRGDSLVVCNVLLKFLLPGAKIFLKITALICFFQIKFFIILLPKTKSHFILTESQMGTRQAVL